MPEPCSLIRQCYQSPRSDSVSLFQLVYSVAGEIGIEQALACLERCVIEKRLAWLDQNLPHLERTANPLLDGYRLFYENYLGLSVPRDGEVVEQTAQKMVTRWWNPCPTLEACQKLGLDTRAICRKVYHRPVQVFLTKIHPRLRFERNYQAIRPHQAYCEEILRLA